MDNYEDRVRVYNEGVLVAISSKDFKTLDLLEDIPERLVPFSIFGDVDHRDNKVPFFSYFISYWLMGREYSRRKHNFNKLHIIEGGIKKVIELDNYKTLSDKIEVVLP